MTKRAIIRTVILMAVSLCAALFVWVYHLAEEKPLQAHPALLIYSPHPHEITEFIVQEFRQRTGIPVTVISEGTGELIERVLVNEDSYSADVFWGGGIESLETIIDHFEEFISSEERMIAEQYRSTHHLWNPFSVLPAVIIYNDSLVPPNKIPSSWNDLLDPWFKNRIIMADPIKSGSSFTILATILQTMNRSSSDFFGAWDYVEKLVINLGTHGLASKSSLVYSSVAEGDFLVGITFENYILSLQKNGANVGYTYPSEGTSAVPDGIALLKKAKNKKQAELFINFVLSKEVQTLLQVRWQRRSVRTDVTGTNPIVPFRMDAKFIHYPISKAASSRESILSQWEALYEKHYPETPLASFR